MEIQILTTMRHPWNLSPCPKCGGKDRFRVINLERGTCYCNQCFTEKNGDYITAVMHFQECSFSDALQKIVAFFGHSTGTPTTLEPSQAPAKKAPASKHEYATTFTPMVYDNGSPKGMKKSCFAVGRNAWGMEFRWNGYTYVPVNPRQASNSKVLKHTLYEYTDGMGEPHHLVYRMDFKTGKKIPALFHWNGTVYVTGKGDLEPIPYNLPAVKEADKIFIVEGEKCAVALQWDFDKNPPQSGSIPAVTCFLDGSGAFTETYVPYFRGKEIFIYPDNDEPGRKYARSIVELLHGVARSIHVYRWPDGTPEGWDIADEVLKQAKTSQGVPGCPGAQSPRSSAPGRSCEQEARPPPILVNA